jgi:hypothetical protein
MSNTMPTVDAPSTQYSFWLSQGVLNLSSRTVADKPASIQRLCQVAAADGGRLTQSKRSAD